MKIFIRGGVWSNVEDQILLAAYMKYGGNQWLRIASLLPRKSASQVKARWEEYLDPTLRKTSWTQKEDEKLLHLARLMPMQWRTISQYFGRSAYQCVERYRELVDKASSTPHYDDNDAAIVHEMMPNFETMNAVPDPVELDQDEKEMLAEARARLANTQGKKARRKARERQLNVFRKIIAMRKKRELEAAGIMLEEKNMWEDEEFELDVLTTHTAKKVRFDTADDDARAKQERIRRIKKKVEERKKNKEVTLNQVKEELKKEEEKLKVPKENKYTELILPEPQISDAELRNIQILRQGNIDFFEQPRSLSLIRRAEKQTEAWNPEPEMEQEVYKTQAVEKELPRPYPVSIAPLYEGLTDKADRLVVEESIRLAYRDADKFPPNLKPSLYLIYPPNENNIKTYSQFDNISQNDLLAAQRLINDEIAGKSPDFEGFLQAWEKAHANDIIPIDLNERIARKEKKVNKLREFYNSKTYIADQSCSILINTLNSELRQLHALARNRQLYSDIKAVETKTLEARIEVLVNKIKSLEKEQIELDSEYQRILQEKKEEERRLRRSKLS